MDYTKKTDRMDIAIEHHRGTILVQQRWKYYWQFEIPEANWSYDEKKKFHHRADQLIWNQWSGRFSVRVEGGSAFAKKYASYEFTVNFDIKWVLSNEHWAVIVRRVPPGGFQASSVSWTNRVIRLDTEDVVRVERLKNGDSYFQYPVAHEFGHAVGNSTYATTHGDEYGADSPFQMDRSSMMNIGSELRERHLDFIIQELNTIIPETSFSINKVR